jgi:hypothetical protein
VVLLYASKYNDVHAVVNISGRFNLEKGMDGRLGKDFLLRLKQHGYIDVFNRKGKRLHVILSYANRSLSLYCSLIAKKCYYVRF